MANNFYRFLMAIPQNVKASSTLSPSYNALLQFHEYCAKIHEFPCKLQFGGKSAVLFSNLLRECKKAIVKIDGVRESFYIVDGFFVKVIQHADIKLTFHGVEKAFSAPVEVEVFDKDSMTDAILFGELISEKEDK